MSDISGISGIAVGGMGVAVGAGAWVGAGVAAGAHAARTRERTKNTNVLAVNRRFIIFSIYLVYMYCKAIF
jgi:hypothetical protein